MMVAFTLLLSGTLASRAAAQERVGDFVVVMDRDELDDSNRSYIFTAAVNDTGNRTVGLAWKCMEDGLNILILFGTYFGGDADDEIQVRYRFDDGEPSDIQYWPLLQGNESAYMPMHLIRGFTEQALGAGRVVVRVTDPLDGETLTDTFDLRGLGGALQRLLPCS